MKKIITIIVVILATVCMAAASNKDYQRRQGVIARVGIEDPAGFNVGVGYQFNPHFALTAEAYSFSGLTSMSGSVDARYYFLDRTFTPYVNAKAGYGILGKNLENQNDNGFIGIAGAGLSWKGFDFGVGGMYDRFHKIGCSVNVSWTLHF